MNSTLEVPSDMYHSYDFASINDITSMNNRLFCTFTTLDGLDDLVNDVKNRYDVLYNKIFVLNIKSNDEYVITYNVDQGNVSSIPENTILVHRKKDTNTLYTINALNEIIKSLNGGVVDTKFPIDWQHYKNCILLTQKNENKIKQLNTRIYKIIEVNQ